MRTSTFASLAFAVVLSPCLALANAAAGVSDERVNLPGAAGSVSGVGENASLEGNQGAVMQSVALEVPEGFEGLTPDIDLSYSTNGGVGVLGVGWAMPSFSIERMTSRGLQRYDADDRFVADGAAELVRVSASGTEAVYRARFEAGFVRYTWRLADGGAAGWWKAEYPDGRVGYFGVDADGAEQTTAQVRVPSTSRTFRWHLVALVDRFGHEMKLTWTKDASGTPLLERVDYVFEGATPRYSLRFSYEARPDVVSDARPGFVLELRQRLANVRLYAGAEVVRAWVLGWEPEADAGGVSRLASLARFGRGDVAYPQTLRFSYSQTLGGVCAADCDKPFSRRAGQVAANFLTGAATLLDINGDSLPDIVASSPGGAHTFFVAQLDGEGRITYPSTGRPSTQTSTAFTLGSPRVQVLDVNGDGFVDLAESATGAVLCNDGSGDWVAASFCAAADNVAPTSYRTDDAADPAQADPRFVRFFDYDNDRRIDWLRTVSGTGDTLVLVNTPAGFVEQPAEAIGAVFDESSLQLADMNGDGLQDPAQILVSGASVSVWYRANLGRGAWGPPETVTLSNFDATQASVAQLQDLNGDGLSDVVAVSGNQLVVALNRNAGRFSPAQTIGTAQLAMGSSMPAVGTNTLVVFADMNGNGSDDVVYLHDDGVVEYVELFPVRPNLLSRVDNGLGGVERFTYGSSVAELSRDLTVGRVWTHRLPNAVTVVTRVERFVTLTGSDSGGLKEVTTLRYHDGFYDGVEKQFRGFAGVERELAADESRDAQEAGLVVQDYDVGSTSPHLSSELLRESVYALPARALLRQTRHTFEVCPVDGAAGAMPAVGFVCERAVDTVVVERDEANAVTSRIEREFDGKGNVVRARELGVVHLGTPESPRECAPCVASGVYGEACGAQCLGDERYTETSYASSPTVWILSSPARETVTAALGVSGAETITYYDGPAFTGLGVGEIEKGAVSRVSMRHGPGATDFIDVERYERDAHGNVAVELEETASAGDSARGHKRFTWDAAGLLRTQVEVTLGGSDVTSLRRTTAYELAFGLISQTSNWVAYRAAMPLGSPQLTRYRFDAHGRMVTLLEPGDTDAAPSEVYAWHLGDPSTRVETTVFADAQGLSSAACFDGRGRRYQALQRVKDGEWQADGFIEFDARGAVVRRFDPYLVADGTCAAAPPTGVPFTRFRFDPLGRLLAEVEADGTTRRMQYAPLTTLRFDELDNDAASPFADTPLVTRVDGLERPVAIERRGVGAPAVTRVEYDVHGNVTVVRDAAGHARTQRYDAMSRLQRVDEPNAGTTTYTYDAAGNELKRVDGQGNVVVTEYDAISRRLAQQREGDPGTRRTWAWDFLAGCAECTNAGGMVVRESWPGARAGGDDAFGYDAEGRAVFRRRTIDGKSFVTRTTWDGADRPVGQVFPGGLAIDRHFDGADRVTGIDGVLNSAHYDARGDLTELRYQNGTTLTQTWDDLRQLTSRKLTGKGGGAVFDLSFTRLSTGLLGAITDAAIPGRVRHQATFVQDGWERTSSVVLPRKDGVETLSWAYDALDNVTSVTSSEGASSRAHVGPLSYDGQRTNAVISAGDTSYAYDDAGRLAARGAVTLERDELGRIVAATGGEVDGTATWADDERIERTEGTSTTWYLGDDLELRDGIATLYVRFGDDVVARLETDALASTVLSDLSGDDTIDIADAWLGQAMVKGVLPADGATPSPVNALLVSAARRLLIDDATWLHGDHLGSLVAATGLDGELRGEQSFYPTGVVRERQGFVDARGFTQQEVDRSTGLTHFAYRDLDVVTGRWDRPDPYFEALDDESVMELGEATTAYAYVANQFVDSVDPDGLKAAKGNLFRRMQGVFLRMKRFQKPVSQKRYDRFAHRAQMRVDGYAKRVAKGLKPRSAGSRALRKVDSAIAKKFGLSSVNRDVARLIKGKGKQAFRPEVSASVPVLKSATIKFNDGSKRRWLGLKSMAWIGGGVAIALAGTSIGLLVHNRADFQKPPSEE